MLTVAFFALSTTALRDKYVVSHGNATERLLESNQWPISVGIWRGAMTSSSKLLLRKNLAWNTPRARFAISSLRHTQSGLSRSVRRMIVVITKPRSPRLRLPQGRPTGGMALAGL